MDAHQLIASPTKNSHTSRPERQESGSLFGEIGDESMVGNLEGASIGVLDVYIHQARDIHNICIYHKQDVFAKICLTSNPENAVSTHTINGGGQSPVFNENLQLNVGTIESSLKCEIWMLSRVKNYLEDQLLGFALVPLSEVLAVNGKLSKEFPLSSTDLFHSPAGFVQLSLSYLGASPEVLVIPPKVPLQDSEIPDSVPNDYDKIQFPDPKIVNENNLMVSQYFGIPSESSECLVTSDTDNHLSSDAGVHFVESLLAASLDSSRISKNHSPTSSVSINGSPSRSNPASSQSFCNALEPSKSPDSDLVSPKKDKTSEFTEAESDSSAEVPSNTFAQSVLNVNIEPEQTMVQQDIVDMYMKSMQQFTESLAKMKLPMDVENGTINSGNGSPSSDQKLQGSKATGSRVFYGSRAFF